MTNAFSALKISEKVYWVGAIDWGLRNFHGYRTSRGSTYNAFLVLGEKVTLIDTVKPKFYDEMMSRIRTVIDPSEIKYIVSNHSEMDHSGAIPQILQALDIEKVFASPKGVEALHEHFELSDDILETVKTGDKVDIGGGTLSFIETRMLHWPDSMFAFYEEEGILFSNDAFGMHLATAERYADELDPWIIRYEGAKYYANILLHLSPIVLNLLNKLPSFNLDIKMIAPDHGPIFRRPEDVQLILDWYKEWAEQKPTNKAVVIYDTMWESTARMASAVAEGLIGGGARVELMPLEGAHRSDVVTELLDAGALLVGSPTMNNQIYPTVADVMNYIKGLKPKNLVGGSFGSHGWSGEATRHLDAMMADIKIDVIDKGIIHKYVPTKDALMACRELGLAVAKRICDKSK